MPESQQSEIGTLKIVKIIKSNPQCKILDIGCGEGKWGKLLKDFVRIDGIEVYKPYIEKYNLNQYYNKIYNVDMRDFNLYPRYDIIILGDVLEHISKEDAVLFISRLKQRVTNIFLSIPITFCPQGEVDGNKYEKHLYHWSDKEIRGLGFKMLNVGVNDNGLIAVGCYALTRKNNIGF